MSPGSLSKGLTVLVQLAQSQRDWGLTELANTLHLDKSTLHRILDTMGRMEFVAKDSQSKRYRIGPRFQALFPSTYEQLKQVALPTIRALSKSLGVTVALRVREGDQMVIIDRVESEDLLRVSYPIGFKHPISFGSSGKLFLAFLPREEAQLAGRIVYHELRGFSLDEVGVENHMRLWLRGGFPRSYLARSHTESDEWRQGFIRTFLERDLPQLGITIGSTALRRFWTMLAHYHG